MIKLFKLKQPSLIAGLFCILIFASCKESLSKKHIVYNQPADSVRFDYRTDSWVSDLNGKTIETLYGKHLFLDSNENFAFASINSENQLHVFNFKTGKHSYSQPICNNKIDAFKIDSTLIYLLYDSILYTKNFNLNTIDSFSFKSPNITLKHSIDFGIENHANLFKLKNYFVVIYYEVDEKSDGTNVYRNTKKLFYYFNKDTSFFANEGCLGQAGSFQYFRYPAVASDKEHLYHAPRVYNCISKSNEVTTVMNSLIEKGKHNYLSLRPIDQYEMSKLKKYRFRTDYNRDILVNKKHIYLLKEFPSKIYTEEGEEKYITDLKLLKYDKQLQLIKTYYIKGNQYSLAYLKSNRLYLFDFYKEKYFIYEL